MILTGRWLKIEIIGLVHYSLLEFPKSKLPLGFVWFEGKKVDEEKITEIEG
jgi:hypothetical protein